MKTLILLLLSFLLISFDGNKPKSDLEKNHLKGKVKSITEVSGKGASYLKSINLYDTNGNLLESISGICPDSSLLYKRMKYFYRNNQLTKTESLNGLGFKDSCCYYYDKNNQEICDRVFDDKGTLSKIDSSFYDRQGNVIKTLVYNRNVNDMWGKVSEYIYYYNGKGYLTGNYRTNYLGMDTLSNAVDYKKYSNGETKEAVYFNKNECTAIYEMKYEEYDKERNWIMAIMYNKLDEKSDTIKREIEYYK